MDYSSELSVRARMGSWQCMECKTCCICLDAGNPVSRRCDVCSHFGPTCRHVTVCVGVCRCCLFVPLLLVFTLSCLCNVAGASACWDTYNTMSLLSVYYLLCSSRSSFCTRCIIVNGGCFAFVRLCQD